MTLEELKKGEHVAVEYKLDIPDDKEKYLKSAVAFANAGGGKLIFGVKNQTWDVIGFADDEVFQKYDAIANSIYDACTPSIVPVMEIEEIDGKKIIVANILPGMDKPYYLRADGMMEGTYIRIAGVTRKAEPYMVKELQLEGTNKSYDATQAAGEEVSTEAINALCDRMYQHALSLCKNDDQRRSRKKVTASQLAQWRILVHFQGKYYPTYAWKLLTGDIDELFPDAFIQMAAFKGKTRAVFLDRQEAKGPIDQQIEEAMIFVKKHINLGSRIAGVYREDIYELPLDSVRELISNAVCHRSYLSPGSIQVAVYDDRLEVTSPGRLSPDLTIEQLIEGNSRVRNIAIGAAFQYMHIIEKWGSGIPRVFEDARMYGLGDPEIKDFGTSFRVSMHRKPFETDPFGVVISKNDAELDVEHHGSASNDVQHHSSTSFDAQKEALQALLASLPEKNRMRASTILDCMIHNSRITTTQIATDTGLSKVTAQRAIDAMRKAGIISRQGSNNGGQWIIHLQ